MLAHKLTVDMQNRWTFWGHYNLKSFREQAKLASEKLFLWKLHHTNSSEKVNYVSTSRFYTAKKGTAWEICTLRLSLTIFPKFAWKVREVKAENFLRTMVKFIFTFDDKTQFKYLTHKALRSKKFKTLCVRDAQLHFGIFGHQSFVN